MSDEVTISGSISLNNATGGTDVVSKSFSGLQSDQTTLGRAGGFQIIGNAAHELIAMQDVVAPRYCIITNKDATNYVELGIDVAATFYPFVQLLHGQSCLFSFAAGITPYALANTAAVKIERFILEL